MDWIGKRCPRREYACAGLSISFPKAHYMLGAPPIVQCNGVCPTL